MGTFLGLLLFTGVLCDILPLRILFVFHFSLEK